jgi:ABC-type transport system involved in cytochrome c biogenesis permease subunit
MQRQQAKIRVFSAFCLLVALIAPASLFAEEAKSKRLALDAIRSMPVFHEGRTKPFDSYANLAMENICHRSKGSIKLGFEDYRPANSKDVPESAAKLFPAGENRSFTPSELVLSWMLTPKQWEEVPFIYAPHESVRQIIGAPKTNDRNLKLPYVSPKQISESESLEKYLEESQSRRRKAMQASETFAPTDLDKLVLETLDRYDEYRAISFDPTLPLRVDPIAQPGSRSVFVRFASEAMRLIGGDEGERSFGATLSEIAKLAETGGANPISMHAAETLAALEKVRSQLAPLFTGDSSRASLSLTDASASVEQLHSAATSLEELLRTQKEALYEQLKKPTARGNESLAKVVRELATNARELTRITQEMRVGLYDEGKGLMVVPSLNVAALSSKRDTNNLSQPWLTLHALLLSDSLTEQFPKDKLKEVRENWKSFAAAAELALAGKSAPDLEESQKRFVDSLRDLGEALEPIREELISKKLAEDELDHALVAYTAYPDAEATAREFHYNTLSPFFWSWCISLGACVAFSLAMGPLKKTMFWLGALIFFGGILFTGYGFYLRVAITGWAPVTNMYETVIFVPYVVAILGLWFLLLPLLWPGISHAWRLTALPLTWENDALTPEQTNKLSPAVWTAGGVLLALPRLALMAYIFWFLTMAQGYSDGHHTILKLLPDPELFQGNYTNAGNKLLVWAVGLICLGLAVWYGPRVVFTAIGSLIFIPWCWATDNLSEMLAETQKRAWFGWAAAAFAAFGTCVAWYSPPDILNKNFSPLQPVLRSNFWLTIHVLTIVASYGAGFLALILGNISIGYLIFGKYRLPMATSLSKLPGMAAPGDEHEETDFRPRPAEAFNEVAQYCYRAIQVAVLLLVAGTILGGVWADVSWGRFWGWDPKEVWALISALVYLAILHGRYAGWFNNVGLVFGTVLGASMIIFSWYGVNFILPMFADGGSVGLHSYGSGTGGIGFVTTFVVVNWVWLAIGLVRYQLR